MAILPELDFTKVLAAPFLSDFYYVQRFQTTHLISSTTSNGTLSLYWSMDGVNTDYIDAVSVTVADGGHSILPIRARYLAVRYTTAAYPSTVRVQLIFYVKDSNTGFYDLKNVGTGAEVFKPSSLELRTVTSTDGSIVVTQNTDTVDVSALSNFTNLVAATENIKVTEAPAGTFTVDVGRDTADALHLGWDTVLAPIGVGSVVLGNGLAPTNGIHVVIGGQVPATYTTGPSADVIIGSRAGNGSSVNNSSVNKVFIGGDAGRNSVFNNASGLGHQVFIGNQAGESSINLEHNIAIGRLAGYGSTKSRNVIMIGPYCGHNAGMGDGAVAIGANCCTGTGAGGGVYIGYNCGYGMTVSGGNNFHNVLIGDEVCYQRAVSENCVAIGYQSCRNGTCAVGSCSVGGTSAYYGAQSNSTNIGSGAGNATVTGAGASSTNIGNASGNGANQAAREVCIGANCACTNVAGRLSFGNTMEAVHGSFPVPAANPQAYLKMSHNGTLYYLPMYTTVPV